MKKTQDSLDSDAVRLGAHLEVGLGPGAGFTVIFTANAAPATVQFLRPLEGELKS